MKFSDNFILCSDNAKAEIKDKKVLRRISKFENILKIKKKLKQKRKGFR